MTQASLNALQPEDVPHGIDIQITASLDNSADQIVGEIYEMDYDESWGTVKLPVLGSNIVGARDGRYTITGTIKSYWINASIRQLLMGNTPTGAGNSSPYYHSKRPFQRFNIRVKAKITGTPVMDFVNVVFEKDATKWTEGTFTEETISFLAEDIYEYQNG